MDVPDLAKLHAELMTTRIPFFHAQVTEGVFAQQTQHLEKLGTLEQEFFRAHPAVTGPRLKSFQPLTPLKDIPLKFIGIGPYKAPIEKAGSLGWEQLRPLVCLYLLGSRLPGGLGTPRRIHGGLEKCSDAL